MDIEMNAEVLAKGLGKLWKAYLKYCRKQQRENMKINTKLRKEYDKQFKEESKTFPFPITYMPPLVHSIYDTPSFEGLMLWLAQATDLSSEHKVSKKASPSDAVEGGLDG